MGQIIKIKNCNCISEASISIQEGELNIKYSRYYQFMKAIREKKVDFGYIHGVNIEKNIWDIYREVVVSE